MADGRERMEEDKETGRHGDKETQKASPSPGLLVSPSPFLPFWISVQGRVFTTFHCEEFVMIGVLLPRWT